MTVLPRSMTSPMVRPSAGTGSSVLASATIWPASVGYGTPCRATMAACCAGPSASHASCQTQSVEGPCTSVSPYRWVTRKPISLIALMTLAGGDEPPVSISTTWSNLTRCSTGALISIASTVGAPHIWVTPCSAIRRKTSRSEEHTSELQSQSNLVCRLLLEKKKNKKIDVTRHGVKVYQLQMSTHKA